MGVVYVAFDPVVERRVAIKTIRLDVDNAPELAHRLRREAKSVGQLEHPNIVTLYDAGESGGLFYLAMQLIHGETLQSRLDRQRWFTLKETLESFRQISAGLDYAHKRGVVHRDIKPANIMITSEGVVKLTDFGIAKLAGTGTTQSNVVVGTPSYMSPEQALGKPLDGRSDIFSLGCILYEMITGEKAFAGEHITTVMYKIVHEAPTPPTALQPGLDPAVESIILRALAKRPEDRFQTCAEFARALELYLSKAVAGVPKTHVMETPAAPPAELRATAPPASGPSPPLVAVPAQTASVPGTTGSTTRAPVGIPLAWIGGGVLGTLLLVVVILLVAQMKRSAREGPSSSAPTVLNTSEGPGAAQSGGEAAKPALPPPPANLENAGQADQSAPPITTPVTRTQQLAAAARRAARRAVNSSPTSRSTTPAGGSVLPAAPETFESLIVKGDVAYQAGDNNKALEFYAKAYKLSPNNREVRSKIVTTLTLLGRAAEAQKYK